MKKHFFYFTFCLLFASCNTNSSKNSTSINSSDSTLNPISEHYDILKHGKKIYDLDCAKIHGTTGEGSEKFKTAIKDVQMGKDELLKFFSTDANAHYENTNKLSAEESFALSAYFLSNIKTKNSSHH